MSPREAGAHAYALLQEARARSTGVPTASDEWGRLEAALVAFADGSQTMKSPGLLIFWVDPTHLHAGQPTNSGGVPGCRDCGGQPRGYGRQEEEDGTR